MKYFKSMQKNAINAQVGIMERPMQEMVMDTSMYKVVVFI